MWKKLFTILLCEGPSLNDKNGRIDKRDAEIEWSKVCSMVASVLGGEEGGKCMKSLLTVCWWWTLHEVSRACVVMDRYCWPFGHENIVNLRRAKFRQ